MPANTVLHAEVMFSRDADFENFANIVAEVGEDNEITVSPSSLQDAYFNLITKNPNTTTLYMRTVLGTVTGGEAAAIIGKPGENFYAVKTVQFTPLNKLTIAPAYYIIGGPNSDWAGSATARSIKFQHSDQDVYVDPVFTVTFDAADGDTWFAIGDDQACDAVGNGDWSQLYGIVGGDSEATEGKIARRSELGADNSFCVKNAKKIRVTINMMEYTYEISTLDFGEFFYEIGNESGWAASHELFGGNGDGKYQGFYYLDGEFKFKPNADNWDDDLEYVDGTTMGGTLTSSGGPNCPDPGAGFYRIDLDASNLSYTLKKIEYVSIIGTANGNWDTDTDLTYNKEEGCWEVTTDLNAGEMKFRGNHNWDGDVDLGGSLDNLVHGGSNIPVEAGNYTIRLFISIAGNHYCIMNKN
jgi:hypothetical protein